MECLSFLVRFGVALSWGKYIDCMDYWESQVRMENFRNNLAAVVGYIDYIVPGSFLLRRYTHCFEVVMAPWDYPIDLASDWCIVLVLRTYSVEVAALEERILHIVLFPPCHLVLPTVVFSDLDPLTSCRRFVEQN